MIAFHAHGIYFASDTRFMQRNNTFAVAVGRQCKQRTTKTKTKMHTIRRMRTALQNSPQYAAAPACCWCWCLLSKFIHFFHSWTCAHNNNWIIRQSLRYDSVMSSRISFGPDDGWCVLARKAINKYVYVVPILSAWHALQLEEHWNKWVNWMQR